MSKTTNDEYSSPVSLGIHMYITNQIFKASVTKSSKGFFIKNQDMEVGPSDPSLEGGLKTKKKY